MARRSYTTIVANAEELRRTADGFSHHPIDVAAILPDTSHVATVLSGPRNNNGAKGCLPCAK